MYAQFNTDTKYLEGYHETRIAGDDTEQLLDPVPANLVYVPPNQREDVKAYYEVITVDDTDTENQFLVFPPDLVTAKAQATMILQLKEEGREIVTYLEDYLNNLAVKYGYLNYHSAMLFKDSTIPKFQQQGQTFFDCTEAIWEYFEIEKVNYATTGHPNLAEVKLAHPKFEDYKTW